MSYIKKYQDVLIHGALILHAAGEFAHLGVVVSDVCKSDGKEKRSGGPWTSRISQEPRVPGGIGGQGGHRV